MARYAWATDVHLDHLRDSSQVIAFAEMIVATNCDGVIISGDISIAKHVTYHLAAIEKVLQRPIYFVLGNHDYYGGTIEAVRKEMSNLARISPFLKYLPLQSYHMLNSSTAIVGHDCWYDGILGNPQGSKFHLTDWSAISDYRNDYMNPRKSEEEKRNLIIGTSRDLATEGVIHIQKGIKDAFRYARRVIVVSHVPPYAESHIYEGKIGNDDAMPWFTCKLLGDMLSDASKAFPDRKIVSLSGHTHGQYQGKKTDNLDVLVGGARYGNPMIETIIDI